jgi:hypothetical protein
MFLLGKEYLLGSSPPIRPAPGQRFVFFTSNRQLPFDLASTIVPAGKDETQYGAGTVALKGKMFERFANSLSRKGEMWPQVLVDATPTTVLKLGEDGGTCEPKRRFESLL